MQTIAVGLSGGVDSAVAALLLKRQGHDVTALFMQNWDDDGSGDCRADDDRRDALTVASRLDVPFHARNFATEYWRSVFETFLAEHRRGRTPNPDVLCNREIKFKVFLEHARALGAASIATGHYARIDDSGGRARLLKARDADKDQSYFLHLVTAAALEQTRFPLGELTKTEVRRVAADAGLAVHAKRDSTGICFIGERDFQTFLSRYLADAPGPIETPNGRVLGEHRGVFFHTLGQRGGLGIGGIAGGSGAPWFVVGKLPERRALIVDQGVDSTHLFATRARVIDAHFIGGAPPAARFEAMVKTRYRQPDQSAALRIDDCGGLEVHFASPQRAVTPGQSLVIYSGDECLGGGIIDATDATYGGLDS